MLAEDAGNSRGWYLLGISHLKLGKAWDASQALYECIKIDENHIDACVNLCVALSKQGRHVQAQKAMRRALKHRRKDPDILFEYAKSLKAEGKLARSENVLRMTVGVNPKSQRLEESRGMQGTFDPNRDNQRSFRSCSIACRISPALPDRCKSAI